MPPSRKMHFVLPLFLLVGPQGASAHAIIVSSEPAAGAAVAKEDTVAIRLRFNSRIDHARSRLKLLAPDGAEQALTMPSGAPADELDAEAKTLAPGAWRLQWQVLSVDGHITRGEIPFTVR